MFFIIIFHNTTVDGKLSDWITWTECSGSCGEGVHFRTRQCNFKNGAPKGKNCTGALREQEKCSNKNDCPGKPFCCICRRQCHYEFNTVFCKSCIVFCAKPNVADPIKLISLQQISLSLAY